MDDHGTALPLDAADREFRDELRAWLDENLVGDFVGQSDRGGPDDDDNWELRRAWEHKLGEGNWLGLSLAEAVRRPRGNAHPGDPLRDGVRRCRRASASGLPRRDADGTHGAALRHRGAEGPPAAADGPRRGRLVPGVLRARRGLRPRQHLHQGPPRGRRVGGQRPEDLDHVRPSRRLDLRDRANRAGIHPARRTVLHVDPAGPAWRPGRPDPHDARRQRLQRGLLRWTLGPAPTTCSAHRARGGRRR